MPVDIVSYIGRMRRSGRRLQGPEDLTNIPGMDGWLSRQIIPDKYPRQDDPLKPAVTAPQVNPPGPQAPTQPQSVTDIFQNLTMPGSRPIVIQRGVSFTLNPGVTPIPITNQPFYCETIDLAVPSTAAQSIFYGFGSSVTTASGKEIRPGLPQSFSTQNTRERWEEQRPLEVICNILAYYFGIPGLAAYRAPRVVFNTNDWYVVSTAATPVAVTLYYTPELQ